MGQMRVGGSRLLDKTRDGGVEREGQALTTQSLSPFPAHRACVLFAGKRAMKSVKSIDKPALEVQQPSVGQLQGFGRQDGTAHCPLPTAHCCPLPARVSFSATTGVFRTPTLNGQGPGLLEGRVS